MRNFAKFTGKLVFSKGACKIFHNSPFTAHFRWLLHILHAWGKVLKGTNGKTFKNFFFFIQPKTYPNHCIIGIFSWISWRFSFFSSIDSINLCCLCVVPQECVNCTIYAPNFLPLFYLHLYKFRLWRAYDENVWSNQNS